MAKYEIVKYEPRYEEAVMELIRREGEDWRVYWDEPNVTRYRLSFARSITYLALADGEVCGYLRALEDALYIYVCDLLVNAAHRGHGLGSAMAERLRAEHPGLQVYVMSGNDEYYQKIGCKREGSVYLWE